jgi:hypothetical protein
MMFGEQSIEMFGFCEMGGWIKLCCEELDNFGFHKILLGLLNEEEIGGT